MTPLEALHFLDNILSQISLSRAAHQQVTEAEQVIELALLKDQHEYNQS